MRNENHLPEDSAAALRTQFTNGELTDEAVTKLMAGLSSLDPPGRGNLRYWLVPRRRTQTVAEHLRRLDEKLDCCVFGPNSTALPFRVTLERVADQPPRFRLYEEESWLSPHQTIESLCLVSWPASSRSAEQQVTWNNSRDQLAEVTSPASQPVERQSVKAPSVVLGARELNNQQKCSAAGIAWTFRDGQLDVTAQRDPARPRVPLIAELAYEDAEHRLRLQRHVLRVADECGLTSAELARRTNWPVRFESPTEAISPQMRVTVREPEARDLVLLDDLEFDEALLTTRYMPIMAESTDDMRSVEFAAPWRAAQELIASPHTAWMLSVKTIL